MLVWFFQIKIISQGGFFTHYHILANTVISFIQQPKGITKKVIQMKVRIPKVYTYADYLGFPEDVRVELIDGVIYDMSPAPPRVHQKIVSELTITIGSYLRQNKRHVKSIQLHLMLFLLRKGRMKGKQAINVVQPDISIICDKRKLTDKGCVGAPEMIIEVVSEYNPSHDYVRKLNLDNQFKGQRILDCKSKQPNNLGIQAQRR